MANSTQDEKWAGSNCHVLNLSQSVSGGILITRSTHHFNIYNRTDNEELDFRFEYSHSLHKRDGDGNFVQIDNATIFGDFDVAHNHGGDGHYSHIDLQQHNSGWTYSRSSDISAEPGDYKLKCYTHLIPQFDDGDPNDDPQDDDSIRQDREITFSIGDG